MHPTRMKMTREEASESEVGGAPLDRTVPMGQPSSHVMLWPAFCTFNQSWSGWKYSRSGPASIEPFPVMTCIASHQGFDEPSRNISLDNEQISWFLLKWWNVANKNYCGKNRNQYCYSSNSTPTDCDSFAYNSKNVHIDKYNFSHIIAYKNFNFILGNFVDMWF